MKKCLMLLLATTLIIILAGCSGKELNKEQTELLLQKTKEVAAQQLKRFIENDFLLLLKTEPSYTKKDYCKIYDVYTDDIISDKFKELDRTIPHEYKKYFRR